jgi:hypothetical protein
MANDFFSPSSTVPFERYKFEELPGTAEEALEARQEEFEKTLHIQKTKAFLEWIDIEKKAGRSIHFNNYEEIEDFLGKPVLFGAGMKEPKWTEERKRPSWRVLPRQSKSFVEYWDKINKKRYNKLPPDIKAIEMELGGVHLKKYSSLSTKVINDALAETLSFNFVDTTDPIYGKDLKRHYWKSNLVGSLIGEMALLMALSGATSALKIPAHLGKLLKKSSTAEKIIRTFGHTPAALQKAKGIVGSAKAFAHSFLTIPGVIKGTIEGSTLNAAYVRGVEQITRGFIFGFKDTLRGAVKKFLHEDQLTEKEYHESLVPFLAKKSALGFLQGFGISAINAPSSWPWRFGLDFGYSAAQQGLNILFGRQTEWDNRQFLYDFALSHAMGEAHLVSKFIGKIPQKLDIAVQKKFGNPAKYAKELNDNYQLVKNHPSCVKLSKDQQKEIASILKVQEDIQLQNNTILTSEQKISSIPIIAQPFKDNKTAITAMKYPETMSVPQASQNILEVENKGIKFFQNYFKWPNKLNEVAKEAKILDSFDNFTKFLTDNGLFKKGKKTISKPISQKDILPIDEKKFLDGMYKSLKIHLENANKKAPSDLSKVDQIFLKNENVQRILRNQTSIEEFLPSKLQWEKINKLETEARAREYDLKEKLSTEEMEIAGKFKKRVMNEWENRKETELKKYFSKITAKNSLDIDDPIGRIWDLLEEKSNKFYFEKQSEGLDPIHLFNTAKKTIKKNLFHKRGQYDFLGKENTWLDELNPSKEIQKKSFLEQGKISPAERMGEDSIYNTDYPILLNIAENKLSGFIRSSIKFLKDVTRLNFDQIRFHLQKFGINRTFKQIEYTYKYLKKKSYGEALSRLGKNVIKDKSAYTLDEMKRIWGKIKNETNKLNIVTGIKSQIDLPSIRSDIKKSGAFVISIDNFFNRIKSQYGPTVANNANRKVAQFIKEHIDKRNMDYEGKKDLTEIDVRNPEIDNNTKFVFTARRLGKEEFTQTISDLFNLLANRYPDTIQNQNRAFSLILYDPKITVNKIDNVSLSHTRSYDDIFVVAEDFNFLKNLIAKFSPKIKDKFDSAIFDKGNSKINKALEKLKTFKDVPLDQIESKTVLEDIDIINKETSPLPKFLPDVVQADIYTAGEKLLGDSPKSIAAQKNKIKNRSLKKTVDEEISEKIDPKEDTDLGVKEAYKDTEAWWFDYLDKSKKTLTAMEDGNLLIPATTKEKAKDLWSTVQRGYASIKEAQKGLFTIFEDIYELDPSVISIYGLQGDRDYISNITIGDLIKEVDLPFFTKYFTKNRESLGESFNRIYLLIRETDFAQCFDGKGRTADSLKPDILDKLDNEKISNIEKLNIDELVENPNMITGPKLFDMKKASGDPLFYLKVAVQKLGVPAKDVLNYCMKDAEIIWKMIDETTKEMAEQLGIFSNKDLWERIGDRQIKDLQKYLIKYAGVKENVAMEELNFRSKEGVKEVRKLIIKPLEDAAKIIKTEQPKLSNKDLIELVPVELKTRAKKMLDMFDRLTTIDVNNLSIISHRIIADPNNKKRFNGEINAYLEGRPTYGKKLMSPLIEELTGRKFFTLEDAIDAGYKVELNALAVKMSVLQYVLFHKANLNFGLGFKKRFLTKFDKDYTALRKLDEKFEHYKSKIGKSVIRGVDSDEVLFKKLNEIIIQEDKIKADFIKTFEDTAGVHYLDNNKDKFRLKTRLENIAERLKEKDLPDSVKKKLGNDANEIRKEQKVKKELMTVYDGSAFTKHKISMLTLFKHNDDLKIESEQKKILEQEYLDEAAVIRGRIKHNLSMGDEYMALNQKIHLEDKASALGQYGLKYLYDTPSKIPRNRLIAPDLEGFEGLYFHRALHKGMMQYLYRNDYITTEGKYEAVIKARSMYKTVNSVMKSLKFWKPLYIGTMDLVESAIATNVLSVKYLKDAAFGIKCFMNRFSDPHNTGSMFWFANRFNLFDQGVSFDLPLKQAVRQYVRMMGKSEAWAHIKAAFAGDEFAEKKYVRGILKTLFQEFKVYQEAGWQLDKVVRLITFKNMYDKFRPTWEAEYKEKGLPMADAQTRAGFLAAEWTAKHCVQYSRIPNYVAEIMNLGVFVPRYKIGLARMYKDTFKLFFKGFETLFKGTSEDTRFKFSQNRYKQAMEEMGPLLRMTMIQFATKAILSGLLGFQFEDTWDMLKGYRLKKVKDATDPFDQTMKIISLSTPIFELNKWLSRPFMVSLTRNMAALPLFATSLIRNKHSITGKRIFDPKDPKKMASQITLHVLQEFFPPSGDLAVMNNSDLGVMEKLINYSGLGFFYDIHNPRRIMEDFKIASSKARTVGERKKALRNFYAGLNHASQALFNEKLKTQLEIMDESVKAFYEKNI